MSLAHHDHAMAQDTTDNAQAAASCARTLRKMSLLAATITHLQIMRVQFSIKLPWPDGLRRLIQALTWPVAFDFAFVTSRDSFCFDQITGAEERLVMAVLIPVMLGLTSIAMAYIPYRKKAIKAGQDGEAELKANKKQIEDLKARHLARTAPKTTQEDGQMQAMRNGVLLICLIGVAYTVMQVACGLDWIEAKSAECRGAEETNSSVSSSGSV